MVAETEGVSRPTVGRWRQRLVERRCDGLLDEPQPGAPRRITDAMVERALTHTLETTPADATLWSTRSLARSCGLSQTAVARIWKAFALQPHRAETFKLPKDPLFIEKVRDIVGLYLNPPDRALVLCVDERSQIAALQRTAPLLPLRPGQIELSIHDYTRDGTTSLFAALDVKSGQVIGQCQSRHRAREFRRFLDTIDANVPANLDVHLILDNYGTHMAPTIHRWLAQRPQYHLHFAPTSAFWINLVERWFWQTGSEATPPGELPRHRRTLRHHHAVRRHLQRRPETILSGPRPPMRCWRAWAGFVTVCLTQHPSASS